MFFSCVTDIFVTQITRLGASAVHLHPAKPMIESAKKFVKWQNRSSGFNYVRQCRNSTGH